MCVSQSFELIGLESRQTMHHAKLHYGCSLMAMQTADSQFVNVEYLNQLVISNLLMLLGMCFNNVNITSHRLLHRLIFNFWLICT